MNIGIVCYPTFGGSGVVATELGRALAAKEHNVHFISYSQPARLDFFNPHVFFHEVSIYKYPLFEYVPYETILASKIVDIVKQNKLDVLHVHYAIPHASAALMAKNILMEQGIDIPIVTTLHGTDITLVGKDPTYEPVVSYSINHSDAVTAVSESLKRDTYANFHIEKPIFVIPNFIDFSRFVKQKKEHFKKAIAPQGEKILVHTSNFRKVKRVEDVIKIFAIVSKQVACKLLLIGDGPERTNIELLSREMGVDDRVTFLGKQEQIEEILSVCDLFILTSETESFGLAALEAMACEVPVISTNTGGIPEVNIEGVTGYLSNIGDVEDMAKNALKLLSNEELLLTFKANALNKAKEFQLDKILPMYEKLYEGLLNKAIN
jgi:N-acetyl-alpha-D-glucosaminyl L-malate synthase BshA